MAQELLPRQKHRELERWIIMGLEFLDAWILGAQRLGDDFKHFQLRVVDSSGSEVGGEQATLQRQARALLEHLRDGKFVFTMKVKLLRVHDGGTGPIYRTYVNWSMKYPWTTSFPLE